jgi:1-deoxy-D-xylulose 5-phosphate reductoisomerase
MTWRAISGCPYMLDIAEEHPDKFEIVALSAGKNVALLAEQAGVTLMHVLASREHSSRIYCVVSYCFSDKNGSG